MKGEVLCAKRVNGAVRRFPYGMVRSTFTAEGVSGRMFCKVPVGNCMRQAPSRLAKGSLFGAMPSEDLSHRSDGAGECYDSLL